MQDTQDMSNTNPYPTYTPAPSVPAKPATPTIAQQTLERLTRIETLVLDVRLLLLVVGALSIALLVGGAFLLGHVWR